MTKNSLDASFIVVNYNSYNYVNRLIESLQKFYSGAGIDIVVVDNNSTEREIEKITESYKDIKLYLLDENIGFSKANNFAAEKCKSKYLIFVNPDVLLLEDCIRDITDFMDNNGNIGACAPKLLNEDMTIQDSLGIKMGLFYEFLEAFFLIKFFRKIYRLKFNGHSNLPVKTAWVSAAFLAVKREVFSEVGGFDPDYFLNYEDIDLCKRLQDKGYLNYYFPFLKCIHYSNQSFKQDYTLLVVSRYLSRRLYAEKHYNTSARLLVLLIQVIGLILRLLTVNLFYKGNEKDQRYEGYKKSLNSYFVTNYRRNNS